MTCVLGLALAVTRMKLTYKAVTVRAEGPSRKEAMDACALRMLKEVGHFVPRKESGQ